MPVPDQALIILARYPVPGTVKSRLARTLGDAVAVEFYRLCAERLFGQATQLPSSVRRYLFYAGIDDEEVLRQWTGHRLTFEAQHGEDFGERMLNAFKHVLDQQAQKAVIVGTDIPDLTAELIEDALERLDAYDVVIGPDHNGGYYLLGMRTVHEPLFRDMPWGTNRVYAKTVKRLKNLGLSVAHLPVLIDIDTEADLRRWINAHPRTKPGKLEDYLTHILPP